MIAGRRVISPPGAPVTVTAIDLTEEGRRALTTSGRIPSPTLDERLQVATVTHRARVAALFGLVAYAALYVAFWLTATPRRWIALLVAAAVAGSLYALLR